MSYFNEYKRTKLLKEYLNLASAEDAINFLRNTTLEDAQFIDKVLTQLAKDGYNEEGTCLSWDIVEQAINVLKLKGEI